MRYLNIRLKNYIPFFNALGRHEVYIDFTKYKSSIIVITGPNGSGKSSLMNSINIFPEDNSLFIDGMPAEKEIYLTCNNNIYHIRCIHDVNGKGDRQTAKAYISKSINGIETELNVNGNISSYKDIVFSEFGLDPNFIELSALGSTQRGLADKRPSERKSFIAPIVGNLNVYNNIYKTLAKRSSIFKSMINTLSNKIKAIGNEEKLKIDFDNTVVRLESLKAKRDELRDQITAANTNILNIDPDGSIQKLHEELTSKMMENMKLISIVEKSVKGYLDELSLNERDDIDSLYAALLKEVSTLETNIQIKEAEIQRMLSERENEYSLVNEKIIKLNSITDSKNFDNIELYIQRTKDTIKKCEEIFAKYNIDTNIRITKDEFDIAINTLININESILALREQCHYGIIEEAMKNNFSIVDIDPIRSKLDDTIAAIDSVKKDIAKIAILSEKTALLENRPSKCNINECPYIADALNAKAELDNLKALCLEDKLENLRSDYDEYYTDIQIYSEMNTYISGVNELIKSAEICQSSIRKLPINGVCFTPEVIKERTYHNNGFPELERINQYMAISSYIDLYNNEKDKLKDLEADYKIYQSSNSIINEIQSDINRLNKKLDELSLNIEQGRTELEQNKRLLAIDNHKVSTFDVLRSAISDKKDLYNKDVEFKNKFEEIKNDMTKIEYQTGIVLNNNVLLENIVKEIENLQKDRDLLQYNMVQLLEYKEELAGYNASYEKIETIRYYSSPNKGIQTIFMELYMNRALSMANSLLQNIFDGEYVLEPFIINDKEFRIPCKGSRLRNDDISSMSTAQICMISMILSLSLLHQSSTKYNVIKLDEIDGGLDQNNRIIFIDVLYKLLSMLEVEQCFLVSHNNEASLSSTDVINMSNI